MKPQRSVFALVIDDDCDQYEMLETILAYEGFSVLTAGNVEQALELSSRYHPFVIITDFGMPELDGGALIERLKSNGSGDIPVIMVSAYPSDYVREKMRAKRLPDVILPKPVDFDRLLQAVRYFYRRWLTPESRAA
jgi:CheY-like chemotaxis protein